MSAGGGTARRLEVVDIAARQKMRDAPWMFFFPRVLVRKSVEGLCFLFIIQNPSAEAFTHRSGYVTTV